MTGITDPRSSFAFSSLPSPTGAIAVVDVEEEEGVLTENPTLLISLISRVAFNISSKYFPAAIRNFSSVGFNKIGGPWTMRL